MKLKDFFMSVLWLLVIDFLLGNATGIHRGVFSIFANSFVESFAVIGLGLSVFGISKAIVNLLGGAISDKIGRKKMVLIGSFVCAFGGFFIAIATSYAYLLIGTALMGIGSGMAYVAIMTGMSEIVKTRQRGLSMGFFELFAYGGFSTGSIIAGFIASLYGLRAPFYLAFVLPLIGGIISYFLVTETMKTHPPTLKQELYAIKKYFKDIFPAYFGGFVSKVGDSLAWSFMPLYLKNFQMVPEKIGVIVGAFTLSWAFSQPFTGYASDRVGRKPLIILGFLIEVVSMIVFTFTKNYYFLVILSTLMGLGTGFYYVEFPAMVGDISPPKVRGTIIGSYRFFRDMGYFVGPFLLGVVADTYGLVNIFYVTAGLLLITAIAIFKITKETVK